MNENVLSWRFGLIFVHPLDFKTCKQMAALSSRSSDAALLGVAALTCLL